MDRVLCSPGRNFSSRILYIWFSFFPFCIFFFSFSFWFIRFAVGGVARRLSMMLPPFFPIHNAVHSKNKEISTYIFPNLENDVISKGRINVSATKGHEFERTHITHSEWDQTFIPDSFGAETHRRTHNAHVRSELSFDSLSRLIVARWWRIIWNGWKKTEKKITWPKVISSEQTI